MNYHTALSEDLLVETRGLTKRFANGTTAVDSLNLSVGRGEVFGFLGPNGAGKTTTLKMLVGLMRPDSGTAIVAGHRPGDRRGLARIGALIETAAFYPYLSGRENLRVLADFAGVPSRRVDEVLEMVELTTRAGGRFTSYSLGLKQRLGVAAALLKDPDLLILDEPTNGLDPQGMADMRALVRSIGQGSRTVLLSSHLLSEVEQVCDRVAVIRGGQLVAQTTVTELLGAPRLLIKARPASGAAAVLATRFDAHSITCIDDAIHVPAGMADPGELAALLVGHGVALEELRPLERSLEDVFFQLTAKEAK